MIAHSILYFVSFGLFGYTITHISRGSHVYFSFQMYSVINIMIVTCCLFLVALLTGLLCCCASSTPQYTIFRDTDQPKQDYQPKAEEILKRKSSFVDLENKATTGSFLSDITPTRVLYKDQEADHIEYK